MIVVGKYISEFNTITGRNLPCGDIYQSDGLVSHVKKHHPAETDLVNDIPLVISAPDYVGKHPDEDNSIELVKRISGNVMVCVKLDQINGYLYVASVFSINDSKLEKRIKSGRLCKY